MSTAAKVPVEVYLKSSYEHDAEYFDGEVQERPMPSKDHAAWQKALVLWFAKHEQEWDVDVYAELRVLVSSNNFLVPDVTVLSLDQPDEQTVTHAPLAVFEVFSPDDRIRKMMRKFDLYEQMRIPEIWFVDPADGIWQRFASGRLVDKDVFSLPERGVEFSMNEVSKLVK